MGAEVFTQSRADRDAELAAHDQLSREAVKLPAEVERLRAEYARATSSRDEYMNLHIEGSDALIEMCGRVDAAEARTEAAEAEVERLREAYDEMSQGYKRDLAELRDELTEADTNAGEWMARLRKVEALADEWNLTEFPHEPTAELMRLDLRAALAAEPNA